MRPLFFSLMVTITLRGTTALAVPTKPECLGAYERAQYARREKKLRETRASLLICAQPACGTAAATDCGRWLVEVESALPTLVFAARSDRGVDLSDVTVTMDDRERVVQRLDGSAVAVDPGVHSFRFDAPARAPVTTSMTVHEGEKSRLITVVLPSSPAAGNFLGPLPPPATTTASLWPSLLIGAIGLASIGGSVVLGVVARNEFDSLHGTCAPFCSGAEVRSVQTKAVISDVLLGTGVLAIVTGFVLSATRHPSRTSDTHAVAHPTFDASGLLRF